MIPNPWVILGIVLAWLASLAGVGYWQHHAGTVAERAAWQGKQIAELATANTTIKKLEDKARATEVQHAADLAVIGADYETKLQDSEDQRRRDLAAARAGTIRLRDPGAPMCADRGGSAPIAASAGGGDAPAPGELSRAVTADLLVLTDDADDTAHELAACQAVIRADRTLP